MTANISTLGRLAFGSANSTYTQYMPFIEHTIGLETRQVHSPHTIGTLEQTNVPSREVMQMVGGDLTLEPSASIIDYWLPKILFGSTSGGVTSVSDTPAAGIFAIWDSGDVVFEWNNLVVDRAVFSGAKGQPIRLVLSLEGSSENKDDGTTFPGASKPTDAPYVFSDITVTLDGTTYPVDQFSITVDYARIKDRFLNSLTRAEIPPTVRTIMLGLSIPFNGATDDAYNIPVAGVAGSLVMNDGIQTYTFAFANLKKPVAKVGSRNRAELMLPINFQSFNDGTNPSLKVTKTSST